MTEPGDTGPLHPSAALEARIGYHFRDRSFLERALSHRSWCAENEGNESNERLEFLGDSVLGLVVTDDIFRRFPGLPEGQLSEVRAGVVNARALADVAVEMGLGECLLLGKGEDTGGGRMKQSILADALEALIAAVYLDGGLEPASRFVLDRFGMCIAEAAVGPGGATTRRASRSSRRHALSAGPATSFATRGPTMPSGSSRPCCSTEPRRERARGTRRRKPSRRPRGAPGRSCRRGARVPELPEIEVLRRDLERDIVGRKIKSVEVDGLKPIRRHRTKKQFVGALDGRKITGVERRGRYLLLRLDGPDVLIVDLGPTGSLVRAKTARVTVTKGTHVVITFTQGGQLRYADPKIAGEMFVTPLEGIAEQVSEIAPTGLDPLEASISWTDFGRLIAGRHAKLKSLLMDSNVITGIGPVYSDEILFAAGLRWDRESDSLTDQEIRRLYRAIVETVQEAVKYAGSRGDNNGIDHSASGEPHHFKVYEREGEACRRCRRPLVKLRVSNRPLFFCEACQV